jgi:hypothetical protein
MTTHPGLAVRAEPDRLMADVSALAAGPRSRRWAPEAMQRAEDYVAGQLTGAGWQVQRQPLRLRWRLGIADNVEMTRRWRPRVFRRLDGANLIATRADARDGPTVLVCAHLDTVKDSPGADDNASGVATVLELARILPTKAPVNVVLAVTDFEEIGILGSRALARRSRQLVGGRVDAVICLESVGYFDDRPGSQKRPWAIRWFNRRLRTSDEGDFILAVCRRSSRAIADRWAVHADCGPTPVPGVVLQDPRPDGWLGILTTAFLPGISLLDRSDHFPFWRRRVPSVMLSATGPFRNARYHQGGDTPDRLDYDRLATVATATAHTLADPQTATRLDAWPPRRLKPRRRDLPALGLVMARSGRRSGVVAALVTGLAWPMMLATVTWATWIGETACLGREAVLVARGPATRRRSVGNVLKGLAVSVVSVGAVVGLCVLLLIGVARLAGVVFLSFWIAAPLISSMLMVAFCARYQAGSAVRVGRHKPDLAELSRPAPHVLLGGLFGSGTPATAQLCREVLRHADRMGWRLFVGVEDPRLRRVYSRAGFVPVGDGWLTRPPSTT